MTPLVSPWSTITRIESYPRDVGRSVMRSMEHCANGLGSLLPSMGNRAGSVGRRLILYC
jgi:hypothetical protein